MIFKCGRLRGNSFSLLKMHLGRPRQIDLPANGFDNHFVALEQLRGLLLRFGVKFALERDWFA
jgi:hypothetical protein